MVMMTMMIKERMRFKVSCKKGTKVSGKSSCRSEDREFKVDKLRRFKEFKIHAKLKEFMVWKTSSLESLPKPDDILRPLI